MSMTKLRNEILPKLMTLYGQRAIKTIEEIEKIIQKNKQNEKNSEFSENDCVLITYADNILKKNEKPLETLNKFIEKTPFNSIHILPYFPYCSDKGFSIINYEEVDPKLGTWEDIENISKKVMTDIVLNHCSAKHEWFEKAKAGNKTYQKYFHVFENKKEINKKNMSIIRRPRTSPLLTKNKEKYYWTTFSKNQIDLNWENEKILIYFVKLIFKYYKKGIRIIRLDAVTYIWKEIGTDCAGREENHLIVQILKSIIKQAKIDMKIITETNVAHEENIKYFGNGKNEADIIYNFSLPPLIIHTLITKDSTKIKKWMEKLELIPKQSLFFNYLDSHDGIGLEGARRILSDEEIENIIKITKKGKGKVTYKTSRTKKKKAYELNITWRSMIETIEKDKIVQANMASRNISLVMKGIPGIYLQGLVGAKNNSKIKENRDINRKQYTQEEIEKMISKGIEKEIYKETNKLIKIRKQEKTLNPKAKQEIIETKKEIIGIKREHQGKQIICMTNISNQKQQIKIDTRRKKFKNIITNKEIKLNSKNEIKLEAYEYAWLK